MRKTISLLLCAALILSLLTGCSNGKLDFSWFTSKFTGKTAEDVQAEQEASAAESTQSEATAVVTEVFSEASSFGLAYQKSYGAHPYTCESLNNRCLISFLYEPLFVVKSESYTAVPVLASGYNVSSDGLTTTVHIRQGITFSNGAPFTAKDAAYSLSSARGTVYYGSRLHHVTSIEATDDYTLTLTTDTAFECLPLLLDIPVIPDGSKDEALPLGTGPYVMDEEGLRLVRNASWWQTAAPIVDFDEIKLTAVESTAEVRDNFEYENVNLVLTDPNSAAFAGFHNDYELWDASSPIMQYIGYNITSRVFSNYGLRSAITYAIDREHIATDIMGGFATAAVLPASPNAPFYDVKLANTYGYSLTNFQQQLESASVSDMDHDGTLDLYVPSLGYAVSVAGTMIVCSSSYQRVEAATEVVNTLNSLGFKLTLKTMELSEYRQALQSGNFDLYYGEIRMSNNFDLSPFFSPSGSMCYGGLDDSVMLNLCNQALANNGNSYNLYKRLCERGYITPVLFKNLAVYTTRGSIAHPTDYVDWFLIPPDDGSAAEE